MARFDRRSIADLKDAAETKKMRLSKTLSKAAKRGSKKAIAALEELWAESNLKVYIGKEAEKRLETK